MKSKTVAESIAELRDRLASIDTLATPILNEDAQPSKLQEHMQHIDRELLLEKGLAGDAINKLRNTVRGVIGKKNPKGVMQKDPKVSGQPRTSTEQPPTPGDVTAHKIGKGIIPGAKLGTAGYAGSALYKHDLTPWNDDNTIDPKTDNGGDTKPHNENGYSNNADPGIIKLQQTLKSMGADLGTTGPNGDGVDGLMGPLTRQAAKDKMQLDLSEPDTQSSAPPVTPVSQNAPPVTPVSQNAPPVTPVSQNAPPVGNSNAEFQSIVDKFEKTFKELEGLTKGDPAAQQELNQIKRSAGY